MNDSSHPAAFELHVGPFVGRDLTVVSFRGRERISRSFCFDVRVVMKTTGAPVPASLVGRAAMLVMNVGGGAPRLVAGILAAVECERHSGSEGELAFRARLVPRLWLLKRRKRSRIFQDQTVIEIVDRVLSEYEIATSWRLSNPVRSRDYCIQHEETDYAFVTRLLAEDGVFFAFERPRMVEISGADATAGAGWAETLLLADDAHYPMLGVDCDQVLLFRDAGGMDASRDHAFVFALGCQVRPNAAKLRDFDYKNPALLPTQRAVAAKAGRDGPSVHTENMVAALAADQLEIYEHHGDYAEPEVSAYRAQQVLEQLRSRVVTGRGASRCRQLTPGHRFVLEDHGLEELNGTYALTGVIHEGRTPEVGGGLEVYSNRFECVPADVACRPRRPRRPRRHVAETATVVGPPGHEIHTDALGRVKVQFHWDLDGRFDDKSSCWIRVTQGWAGPGWGFQFIPRVGMEVVVTFLGGDPDRPVITGCLYNSVNPPSHDLPRQATKSGIRTRTSPGPHGFNELSFEDRRGHEAIFLHAQRDFIEIVEHHHKTVVGRFGPEPTGDQSVQVAANQHVSIGADQTITVSGHHQETILGGRTEMVSQGVLSRVEGLHEQRDDDSFSHRVGLNHKHAVGGDLSTRVAGNTTVTTGGDHRVTVHGQHKLTVSGSMASSVHRDYALNAGDGLTLRSAKSIRLVCGESEIALYPDEIIVTSPTVTVYGKKTACLHGEEAVLQLEKSASLVSKEVTLSAKDAALSLTKDGVTAAAKKNVELYSKGASVVLDSDAAIDGSKVKLNCAGDSDGEYDEPSEIEASWTDILLTRKVPQDGDPSQLADRGVAGARFTVEASDGRIFKGVLDGDGKARVPIPPGSAKVSFLDYDSGTVKAK